MYPTQKQIAEREKNTIYYRFLEFHDDLVRMFEFDPEEEFEISEGAQEQNESFLFYTCRMLARKAARINKRKFTPEQKQKEIEKAQRFQYYMENIEHLPTAAELFD